MRTVIRAASILVCAFSLDAQITVTLNRLPSGMDEVRIRDNSATSVVAFVVTINQAPRSASSREAPFVVFSDPLIEPAIKPLSAGEERVVMARGTPRGEPSGRRLLQEPILAAGILSDGTTTGDAALVTRLILRRSNMLQSVEMALEMLSDAGRSNIPRDRLIEQFRKLAHSVSHWYLPPEQQVGRILYQSIMGKLMSLPEGQVGSPFPPASFVEQETAALNRQRVTLLESQPSLADAAFIGR